MNVQQLMASVRSIEGVIQKLNVAMRQTHPHSVGVLRKHRTELELLLESLMNSCIMANVDIEGLLSSAQDCIRECIRPIHTSFPLYLPHPQPYVPPKPVVTVPGVNLVLYLDSTGSMQSSWRGLLGTEMKTFANYLAGKASAAGIPFTVSVVWYGDIECPEDASRGYFTIALNKADVSQLSSTLSHPVNYAGCDIPESGLNAIKATFADLKVPGVANYLIMVTDAKTKQSINHITASYMHQQLYDGGWNAFASYPVRGDVEFADFFKHVDMRPDIGTVNIDFHARNFSDHDHNLIPWADYMLNPYPVTS